MNDLKATKFLTFDEGSMTVTVHDNEDTAKDDGGEALGTFVHEFNIDPFSGVKYPVLEQHVLDLIRAKTEDVSVQAQINRLSVTIVPGYVIDLPASERNQSYDGVRQEDGHVKEEVKAKPKRTASRAKVTDEQTQKEAQSSTENPKSTEDEPIPVQRNEQTGTETT